VALADVARPVGALDQIVDEAVDARGAGRAEQLDLGSRQVALAEQAEADRVVDVVVDVGNAVDDADDLALERRRLAAAGVREDAVADLGGEVEALGNPERLLVVAERPPDALPQDLVESVLAGMAEGGVAQVVA